MMPTLTAKSTAASEIIECLSVLDCCQKLFVAHVLSVWRRAESGMSVLLSSQPDSRFFNTLNDDVASALASFHSEFPAAASRGYAYRDVQP